MVDDDDGRTPDHGHSISSPCEPKGSCELKSHPNYNSCDSLPQKDYLCSKIFKVNDNDG